MIVGAGLTAGAIIRRARENAQHPERQPQRMAERLARRMKLSDEQSAAVAKILEQSWRRLEPVRDDALSQIRAELDRVEGEVAAALPAEKQEQWRNYVRIIRDDWLPTDKR